jgi:hypothetical protein
MGGNIYENLNKPDPNEEGYEVVELVRMGFE